MKQIFIPNITCKFDKIRQNNVQEKFYLIALSSNGLYHFDNNKVKKIIENVTNSFAIEFQTCDKLFEVFINELNVDSLNVSNLPLDIKMIPIQKDVYQIENIRIFVESQNHTKQVWFECDDNVTMDSLVEEISSILSLINV